MKKDKVDYEHSEDTIRIWCQYCGAETRHKVLLSATTEEDKEVTEDSEGYVELLRIYEQFQTIQCQGCNSLSTRKREYSADLVYVNNDDYKNDEMGGMATRGVQEEHLYPPRVAGIRKLNLNDYAPEDVSKIYDETYLALANKQNILAATGIRVIIETVCSAKSVDGFTLRDKIASLVRRGILSSERAQVLSKLVRLGNIAVHQAYPVAEEAIRSAMEVINHLLYSEYVLPKIENGLLRPRHRR